MEKRIRRKLKWILLKKIWDNIKIIPNSSCDMWRILVETPPRYYDKVIEIMRENEIPKFMSKLPKTDQRALFEKIDNANAKKVLLAYPDGILEISKERLTTVFNGEGEDFAKRLWDKIAYKYGTKKFWQAFCEADNDFLNDFINVNVITFCEFLESWKDDKENAWIKKIEPKISVSTMRYVCEKAAQDELKALFQVMKSEKIGDVFKDMGSAKLVEILMSDFCYLEFLAGKVDVCNYLTPDELCKLFKKWYKENSSLILKGFSLEQRAVIYNVLVNANNPDRNYISAHWYVDIQNDKEEENSYRFYGGLSPKAQKDCIENFIKNDKLKVAKKFLEDAKNNRELDITEVAWEAYIAQQEE